MKEIFVFCYGSNMLYDRLSKRLGNIQYFNVGKVSGFTLKFHKKSKDGSGKANCFKTGDAKDKVYGVIYSLAEDQLSKLDKIEGVGFGYSRVELPVNVVNPAITKKCYVYVADEEYIDESLKPYKWYHKYVLDGAKENYLKPDYIINEIFPVECIEDNDIDRKRNNSSESDIKRLDIGGYDAESWYSIRDTINGEYEFNKNWEKAIKIFKSRINKRYLNGLKSIPENDFSGIGFSIVSIICILIETLAGYKYGKIHVSVRKPGGRTKYEYKDSDEYFEKFLLESSSFKKYFESGNYKKPIIDFKDFYKNVRSSLIHEACTKNGWMINTKYSHKLNPKELFTINSFDDKQINRTLLLESMITEFDDYYSELRNPKNVSSRRDFARKMDHLCEILPSQDYEWWKL